MDESIAENSTAHQHELIYVESTSEIPLRENSILLNSGHI